MTLLLATTNPNKVREVRPLFAGTGITVMTLADVPAVTEPEEAGSTFWENARLKALGYAQATGHTAVAEDSGLVIDSLGGEPGVQLLLVFGAHTIHLGAKLFIKLPALLFQFVQLSGKQRHHRRFAFHDGHPSGRQSENEIGIEALPGHRVIARAAGVVDC